MAPTPSTDRDGRHFLVALEEVPLPRVLAELAAKEASGSIALQYQNIEKTILVQQGKPVFAQSNIAEENLGRFLVKRKLISEDDAFRALTKAINDKRYIGEAIVELELLSPNELFKALKRSFGARILDAFRWHSGTLEYTDGISDADDKILLPIEPLTLIIRGVESFAAFTQISSDSEFASDGQFQMLPNLLEQQKGLTLNAVESRISRRLAQPCTIDELAEQGAVSPEMAYRFVYAMNLLGLVMDPERVAEVVEAEAAQQAVDAARAAEETDVPTSSAADTDEDKPLPPMPDDIAAAVDKAYLLAKSQDYFRLLGLHGNSSFSDLRTAYLSKCATLSPAAFSQFDVGDRKDRLDELFLTFARAFVTLSDVELRERYQQKMGKTRSRARGKQSGVSSPFEIKTALLDSTVHLQNGIKAFREQNTRQAITHLKFAIDIEPDNAEILSWYGYCLFACDSVNNQEEAMRHLKHALDLSEQDPLAHSFLGRICESTGEAAKAAHHYRRALAGDPKSRMASEGMRRLAK